MQSLTLRAHTDKDGILRLEVPLEFADTEVEVLLVWQPVAPGNKMKISRPGDRQNESFVREPQGEYGVQFQLPANLLQLGLSKDDIQQRVSEWVVLSLFTEGRISSGKAAHFLGISRLDFLSLLKARGIAYVNYSAEELDEEIEAAKRLTMQEK